MGQWIWSFVVGFIPRYREEKRVINYRDLKFKIIVIDVLRVAFAMAPINTGGIAINMHPNAATYDKTWALPAVLLDKTR